MSCCGVFPDGQSVNAKLETAISSIKRRLGSAVESFFRCLILLYRYLISPMLGPRCRYWPSCSEYCLEALACHGTRAGLRLGAARLLRCHPWGSSGYDPVPRCASCEVGDTAPPVKNRGWPAQLRQSADADQ